MNEKFTNESNCHSELIDERINELGDWRGDTLAKVRNLIKRVDDDVIEDGNGEVHRYSSLTE